MRRRRATLLVLATLLPLVAACSSGGPDATPSATPTASVSSAPPAPAPAAVGSCHQLTVPQATEPVDTGPAVPCVRPHTAVTIKVGSLAPVVDGHLLALDSRTVRAAITRACPPGVTDVVGGDRTARRLSRLEVVWFSPSLEQADAGANWFRCDVVALRSAGALLPLPASVKGLLDKPGALDRFGTCGTAAPGARGFTRVACSERHTWRAVDVVDLPAGTRYLDKAAGATGDATCKGIAARRANGALKFSWSFEWPTREQWDSGQRYGYCWLPGA